MSNPLDLGLVLNRFIEDMNTMEREERAEKYGARDHFYFSESGGCPRKIAYSFYGLTEEPKDARSVRIFHNGEYVQLRYEQYLRMLGVFVSREISLNTYEIDNFPARASGRMDIIIDAKRLQAIYQHYFMGLPEEQIPDPLVECEIIELEPGFEYYRPTHYPTLEELYAWEDAEPGRLGIVEMKSASKYSFESTVKGGTAKSENAGQLGWYQFLTGITHGWVAYENKNDQEFEAFYQARDERLIVGTDAQPGTGFANQFADIQAHIDAGTVPARCSSDPKKFPCSWKGGQCNFFNHCWNAEHNGEFIPGVTDAQQESDDITIEEVKGWLDSGVEWVKLIDANGNGNTVLASMPKVLRDQMLDFLYPNATEVEWAGMNDEQPAERVGNNPTYEPDPVATAVNLYTETQQEPEFVSEWTNTHCSLCGQPQFTSPGGVTCENGHDLQYMNDIARREDERVEAEAAARIEAEKAAKAAEEAAYNARIKAAEAAAKAAAEEAAKAAAAQAAKPATPPGRPGMPRVPGAVKPTEPVVPKVIKVTYENMADSQIYQVDMTHDEYLNLCIKEDQGLVQITDGVELADGYFAALSSGDANQLVPFTTPVVPTAPAAPSVPRPGIVSTAIQNAALSGKPADASVKESEGVAVEQVSSDGTKYIYCAYASCTHGDPIEFKRLGNGGTIKCPGCKQTNTVKRLS